MAGANLLFRSSQCGQREPWHGAEFATRAAEWAEVLSKWETKKTVAEGNRTKCHNAAEWQKNPRLSPVEAAAVAADETAVAAMD